MKETAFIILFLCLLSCTSKNKELYIINNRQTYDLVNKNIVLNPKDNLMSEIFYHDTIVRESPLPKTAKESKVSKVAIVSGSDTIFDDLYRIDLTVDSIVSRKNNYIIYGGDKHAIVVWPKVYGKPDVGINKKTSLKTLKITNYQFYWTSYSFGLIPYFMAEDDKIEIKAYGLKFVDRCYYYVPVDKP